MRTEHIMIWIYSIVLYIAITAHAAEIQFATKQEIQAFAEQIEKLKNAHSIEIIGLKKEIEVIRDRPIVDNGNHNCNAVLIWAQNANKELRTAMKDISKRVNSSELLRQLNTINNQMRQALVENSDLVKFARLQEIRVDKVDSEIQRVKYDQQQIRVTLNELRTQIRKLSNEIKPKLDYIDNNMMSHDIIEEEGDKKETLRHEHKLHNSRHNRMLHVQMARLAQSQSELDSYQQTMQMQLIDFQRRFDRFEAPNWKLMKAKMGMLASSSETLNEQVKNITQKISDLDKIHSSVLELREEVEGFENKIDKTIPDFRKEISKLDVNVAQVTAQASYLKEDQENLRQSVKAIAVSISNTIDKAVLDRLQMKYINDTVNQLKSMSHQHFYRLNDHILKSEANKIYSNINESISLPELMGEVKELQPVEREYEDLVNQLPRDCSSISGPAQAYLIRPSNTPVEAWCVNGSTLLQRRYNGSVDFNKNFAQYVQGFGDPSGEYWLGLEAMHQLTVDNCTSMRIDMIDIYGGAWYAQYESFSVGSSESGYTLYVGGFEGNASDAFEYQNHMKFSAIDRDRDTSNTHCAANYEGGWWYSHCQHVNINGKYTLGLTWYDSNRNEWVAVASDEMKLYRKPECPSSVSAESPVTSV